MNEDKVRKVIENLKPIKDLEVGMSKEVKICQWKFNVHYNAYETKCDKIFCLSDEIDNYQYFNFCPYCGREINDDRD